MSITVRTQCDFIQTDEILAQRVCFLTTPIKITNTKLVMIKAEKRYDSVISWAHLSQRGIA